MLFAIDLLTSTGTGAPPGFLPGFSAMASLREQPERLTPTASRSGKLPRMRKCRSRPKHATARPVSPKEFESAVIQLAFGCPVPRNFSAHPLTVPGPQSRAHPTQKRDAFDSKAWIVRAKPRNQSHDLRKREGVRRQRNHGQQHMPRVEFRCNVTALLSTADVFHPGRRRLATRLFVHHLGFAPL